MQKALLTGSLDGLPSQYGYVCACIAERNGFQGLKTTLTRVDHLLNNPVIN